MSGQKKIVLHVGLPKTGTSALQLWCNNNREALHEFGNDYPEPDKNLSDPKHEFLVPDLQRNDLEKLRRILAENQWDVILLSTEGLTNHLYDFDPNALQTFRDLTVGYEVTIFLVAREEGSWLRSYYKQLVVNPPITEYNYATPLHYPAFCQLPRVRRLTDIPTLRTDLEAAFGAKEIVMAQYEEDWTATFLGVLGMANSTRRIEFDQVHDSVSDDLAELIRQVNAMQLPHQDRAAFLACVQACFLTNNHTLQHRYKFPCEPGICHRKSKEVLGRLVGDAPGQAKLIDQLSAWLISAQQLPQSLPA